MQEVSEEISLSFEIPGKPGMKARARTVRIHGIVRSFTPKDTAIYENRVVMQFIEKYPNHEPVSGALSLFVVAYFPISQSWSKKKRLMAEMENMPAPVRPDADNCIKSIMDALQGIAYHNDSQICFISFLKRYSPRPRVEIKISNIAEYGKTHM